MSQPLQRKNTRILLTWLPLVMLAGSIFFYFLMRGHILHMKEQQLRLKQTNIWRAWLAAPGGMPLHLQGEYDIVPVVPGREGGFQTPAPSPAEPKDTILDLDERGPQSFSFLTSRLNDQGKTWQVTTFISSKEITHLIIKVALAEAVIFLLLLGAVVVINRSISLRLWAPFYKTMDTVGGYDIRKNEMPVLSETTGVEEFDRLNQTLTSLIGHMDRAYQNQKQFTENAAHELQTPLAIIRSKVELMMEGSSLNEDMAQMLADINEANERLSQMNRNLLLISRIDNRQFADERVLDLSLFVAKQAAFFGDYFQEGVDKTTINIDSGVQLTASPALIEILINNLLRNAYIHNVPGGYVLVSLTDTELTIENSGPPVTGDPAQLFERFKKGREDSRTTGLGLALVRQICQLYQWQIRYDYQAGIHKLTLSFVPGDF